MSLGMGNYRHFHEAVSRYLSITTHTPPKTTGVVTPHGLSKMPLLTINYTTLNLLLPCGKKYRIECLVLADNYRHQLAIHPNIHLLIPFVS